GVACVARLVDGDRQVRWSVRVLRRDPGARQRALPLVGEILSGPRRDDVGVREGRLDVHTVDARVREGASYDAEGDHARGPHVADPWTLAFGELLVFLPLDRRADDGADRCLRRRAHPVTAAMASTMFW